MNGLINETIESINANSQQVSDTIGQIAGDVGYELDKPLKDIITANDNNSNNMYDLVAKYDENFSNKMTAVKTSIDNIYISVSQLVKKSEDEAKKKLEEQKKQQQNIVSNKKPSSSSTSSGSSSSSSNKGSSSSSSSKGGFFVKKKFNGNKKSLNINNSIVDRLKYRDFDSSFSRRGIYYKAMGGSGKYTGSSKQNIFMLNWMKKNGYSHSGSIKSMVNTVNEDGLFLGRKDDVVIAKQDWDTIGNIIDKAKGISSSNFDNSVGDVYIQMDLSSITNYEEFMNKLKSDKTFIKYIKASINSSITGKNNFRKNRFM